jgi:hypothetical protein
MGIYCGCIRPEDSKIEDTPTGASTESNAIAIASKVLPYSPQVTAGISVIYQKVRTVSLIVNGSL